MVYDCIIIGGGPAGLTAGIYSARAGKKVLLIERLMAGGEAGIIPEIENYPGFESISGYELIEKMTNQAVKSGVEMLDDEVYKVELEGNIKKVIASNEYHTKSIILAMGCRAKGLGLSNEKDLLGMGVSYCAVCDGNFYRNKDVAVVGSGAKAINEAKYLSTLVNKVYLITKLESIDVDKENIIVVPQSVVSSINGVPVESINVKNVSGVIQKLNVNGVFIAVGYEPISTLVLGKVDMDSQGFIITDENMQTSVNKVYAVGDIRKKGLKQIVTACSDGAIAGSNAIKK